MVIIGNDPIWQAYETRAYPSRLYHLNWHRATDLNRKPLILEITALPIELARYVLVRPEGLKPSIQTS